MLLEHLGGGSLEDLMTNATHWSLHTHSPSQNVLPAAV
jgi:hypothetical protein